MEHSTPSPEETLEKALFSIKKVIVGQEHLLRRMLLTVVARGHILLEGVPGLAKTLTVKTVAKVLGGKFSRIQFTPDLVPADLIGSRLWRPDTGSFTVESGPVFANFVLADEINRAPAKVQSALLEVMEERQVTIGSETLHAPDPFFVLATQNPIESEGVYPLPEAQSDRFLFKVLVGYPTSTEEQEIVRRVMVHPPEADNLLNDHEIRRLQTCADKVYVDPAVISYATSLVGATRPEDNRLLGDLSKAVSFGASPRASLALIRGAKALAVFAGRPYAVPQDVVDLAYDALRHRIVLDYQAIIDGVVPEHVIHRVLQMVPMPQIDLAIGASPPVLSLSENGTTNTFPAPVPEPPQNSHNAST